jgi:hypothetical protein
VQAWRTISDVIMPTEAAPTTAQGIRATTTHFEAVTDQGVFEVPRRECSDRPARATKSEPAHALLSPSGYGIHWPLIDDDLAAGPLVRSRKPKTT